MVTQLKTADLARSYTNEEFETLPQFDQRYELIEGKIVEKEMAGDEHGRIIENLSDQLTLFGAARFGRKWRDTTFDLGQGWLPIPDLAFVVAARVPAKTKKSVKVVPDLVVEVHSPSDLGSKPERDAAAAKIAKYLAAGVKWIWAINPEQQLVEVYQEGQAEPVKTVGVGEELEVPDILPNFKFKVAELFAE